MNLLLALLASGVAVAQDATAPNAAYPPEARDAGIEGSVVVRLTRDAAGVVTGVEVVTPAHPLLDAAAVDSAWGLRLPIELGTVVDYRFDFFLGTNEVGGQGPATLHGTAVDPTGVTVPGVQVTLRSLDSDAAPLSLVTGPTGKFDAPTLRPGRWELSFQAAGFGLQQYTLQVKPGDALTSSFVLVPDDALEVTVYASRNNWREVERGAVEASTAPETGAYTLTRRDIEATPGSLEDVARAAHALPGVVSDSDLLAGFRVRGGETTDVVFQLDRVPLENPFHLAGFNSVFNPDMIQEVKFFAGAAPADLPSSTSAVMSVVTWDGSPREAGTGIDGAVDLSASSARGLLMGPIDKDEHFTFALAARRTYLEGYLQVLEWVNLVDSAFAAPEFTELSARTAWRPNDHHRVMASAVYAGDSLAVVDSEDDSAITVDGTFSLANRLFLFTLDHRWKGPRGLVWQTTAARVEDRGTQERTIGGTFQRDDFLGRWFGRTDLTLPVRTLTVETGADASRFGSSSTGRLSDNRAFPTWAQAGIAPFEFPDADVDASSSWGEANAYLQGRYDGVAKLRVGVRQTWSGLLGANLTSPSAGVSLPLPTGTIPKATVGLYHRVERDPTRVDPDFGNPDLEAESAAQIVVGVDQAFPLPGGASGGLVRVEVYDIELANLVVNPDDPSAVALGTRFENLGTGRNQGLDAMVVARQGVWNVQATYGLLFAARRNPLLTQFPFDVKPAGDQRHTASLAGDLRLSAHWTATARYTFHTGRPVARVAVAENGENVVLDCLNCDRLGPLHQVDLRAEWRRAYRNYRRSFYMEVLNVGNIQSDFLPIHDVIDGELSTTMFRHLPMRPFLGLRFDF